MHPASYDFMSKFVDEYLSRDEKLKILDVGSYDVNGTNKPIFEGNPNWEYHGMDIVDGPNVDIVGYENIKDKYDVIISSQCMEHVKRPWEWLPKLKNYAKDGALICVITPHTLYEHKYPIDTYRYFPDGMQDLFEWSKIEILDIWKGKRDTVGIGKIGRKRQSNGLDDFTICITATQYPLAEMCVGSLRRFYPDVKIRLAFNTRRHFSPKRLKYFEKFNIEILPNQFYELFSPQVDRLVRTTETKYCILCDDDVFFRNHGILEYFNSILEEEDYFAIGHVNPHYWDERQGFRSVNRIVTFFCLYEVDKFLNFNMTFKQMREMEFEGPNKKYEKYKYLFYDAGSSVFFDIFKYGLPFFDIDGHDGMDGYSRFELYFKHYGALSGCPSFRFKKGFSPINHIPEDENVFLKLEDDFFIPLEDESLIEKRKEIIRDNNNLFDSQNQIIRQGEKRV